MNVRLPRSFVSKLVLRFLFSESSTTDENERMTMTTTTTTQHAANERTNERERERTNERACRNDDDDDELWCRASVSQSGVVWNAFGKMNTTWSYMIKQYESLKKTAADDEPKRDMKMQMEDLVSFCSLPSRDLRHSRTRSSDARTTHGLKRNAHQSAL
jgi:hypothetical protein